jgi:DNA-binding response OmpR family regulator
MPRILSIEDDPDFQHLVALAFQNEGYEIHYAFTGKEGYEKVLSLNPDLILLDMMLPILNGVEVIKAVKKHKAAKDIPIIVMTAYPADANFVESTIKALGALEYVRKPVDVGELLRLVRRMLAGGGERTAPGSSCAKDRCGSIPSSAPPGSTTGSSPRSPPSASRCSSSCSKAKARSPGKTSC